MPNRSLVVAGVVAVLLVVGGHSPVVARPLQPQSSSAERARLDQYCVGCHNDTAPTAGLSLEGPDLNSVASDPETWERVVRRLRAGMMPPPGAPRPDSFTYNGLVTWLERELDRNAVAHLAPPGLHRLNRTEYANAIRDLLDLEINPATLLPADDSSFGFDNMAGTLGISSTLVEAYVSAAQKVSRLAMGSDTEPLQVLYRAPEDTSQDYHIEGLPFGTRGGMRVEHEFPADGEYFVTILPLAGDNMSPGPFGSVNGEQLEVLLDGQLLELTDFPGRRGNDGFEVAITTTAGQHVVGATFLETNFAPLLDINRQFERDTIQTGPTPGFTFFPHVGSLRIEGPFNASPGVNSPSRRRVFSCRPADATAEAETACATQIVNDLTSQAFRGMSTDDDIADMMEFYDLGRAEGDFDHGIETALAGILSAVKFIYRIEAEPADLAEGEAYAISDLEFASRLSFFLWSSMPDERLLRVAESGQIRQPDTLRTEVRRMLADARADAFAVNFAGQWLNLRGMESVGPLAMLYPDFDNPLRQAMRREVELLFDSIIREDRNVLELLTADYTFVNERLARHYGIPNIYGSQFRRVMLDETDDANDARRGLLGKGAILTTTSKPERTSPVTRGKWIMTNILGVSPPDPPADVPALPQRQDDGSGSVTEPSMREKMADHQVRADCVQCHRLMDPIGLSLENFDGIAMWRDRESNEPIDASGVVYDGTAIDGPSQLREWILGYSDQFLRVVTEKLLTYALGRGVEYQDMPVVRSITREAGANNNRFSAIVIGVVESNPFQMNVKSVAGGE